MKNNIYQHMSKDRKRHFLYNTRNTVAFPILLLFLCSLYQFWKKSQYAKGTIFGVFFRKKSYR